MLFPLISRRLPRLWRWRMSNQRDSHSGGTMYILKHIPEQCGAFEDSLRWAPFSTASAPSLAVMLLAVGCGQEATGPQHPGPISPQVVSGSNQSAVGAKPIQQFHDHFTGSFSTEICGIPADGGFVVSDNFSVYADG